jgi:hypothetical protein
VHHSFVLSAAAVLLSGASGHFTSLLPEAKLAPSSDTQLLPEVKPNKRPKTLLLARESI